MEEIYKPKRFPRWILMDLRGFRDGLIQVSYIWTIIGVLYTLPSSTLKLFSSENTTLDRIMTETELSLMGSVSSVSTLIIMPFCGYLLDSLGRKRTLILFYLPQLLGWLLIATIFRVEAFICSMVLCGLSGSIYLIVPIYVNEFCDDSIRGAMSTCAIVFHGVGLLVSYLFGGLLEYNTMNYTGLTLTVFGFVLICFLKESPLYLMKKGFEEEAAKTIAFFKGEEPHSKQVITEMDNIRHILNIDPQLVSTREEKLLKQEEKKPKKNISILKYFAKSQSTRRSLMCVLVLYTSCIFQGLVVVQIFAEPLFEAAAPNLSATILSVLFAIITIVAGFVGAYLIDTIGRRILIIWTSIISGVFCVILGTILQLYWIPSCLNSVFLYLYAITYSLGPGSVPYVLMGEVFLPEVKSFASMVCLEWSFICNFIILFIFNPVLNAYGLGPIFYCFAGFSIFTAFFSFFYIPETKGLSVDVIQRKFLERKKYKNCEPRKC